MTGGEVERITDPATIRNIDWSDHYETTTPRGATPMFDAAQDLSEREADANALEAYRALVTTLEADNKALRDWRRELLDEGFGYDDSDESAAEVLAFQPGWRAEASGFEYRLEEAEERVDQLTDLLTLRTEALNRTGESNDRLRAQIEAVRALLVHLHTDLVYAGDIRAILDTEGES